MRPSPLPALSWHIAFASDSSLLDVVVDAAAGHGRTNGRRHSHRSGREERKCLLTSQMSADAPQPFRTACAARATSQPPDFFDGTMPLTYVLIRILNGPLYLRGD